MDLLLDRSFQRGDFVLASGARSPYYVDARQATMSGRGLALVGELGLDAIRAAGWEPDLIGGLTLGADPVAYAVALRSQRSPPGIDAFTVRKEPKSHGTGRQIEGPFRSGASVVIVEDVVTTGGSALRALEAVTAAGAKALGVLAVLDRGEGGREQLARAGCPLLTLATLAELVARQEERGRGT